ncbi:MAG: glycine betaine ABC transporter substrate-binding protein [Acidimicrobiia bacterium]
MKYRLFAITAALALLAVACGGGTTTTTAEGGAATTVAIDPGNPTINIVVNAWTASALNVEIAKQLIEGQLGYPVEAVSIDENAAMFTGLADGTVDAVLELWPSGITPDEQPFFDDGSVVDIGDLGAVGKIGWFVPQYVVDEHPELATWEGFQDPELASLFGTAETGELGRFLGTDPSYAQYDEAIIENLELPLQVVFSGSEPATVAELDTRFAAQEPIVMYWWTPTAAVAKYDLVNVTLPAYSEECYTDPAQIACDYPEDVLMKVASAQLQEKAPDVWEFLSNFTITTDDQLAMLPPAEIDGEDVSVVAAEWINTHQDVWSAWLP